MGSRRKGSGSGMRRSSSQPMPSTSTEIIEDLEFSTQPGSTPDLSSHEIESQLNACVTSIILQARKENSFKRADLLKSFKNTRGKKGEDYIRIIRAKLLQTFGLDLIETTSTSYILVNKCHMSLLPEEDKHKRKVFLSLILGAMFHCNFSITEDRLSFFLTRLGISPMGEHEFFGNVQKELKVLEKQKYIVKEQIDNEIQYSWGKRSYEEIGKEKIFEFLCRAYEKKPEDMCSQFRTYAWGTPIPPENYEFNSTYDTEPLWN